MAPEFLQYVSQDTDFYQGAMLLFVSILLARIAPLPRQLQPMVWLQRVAKDLSRKVNHTHRAPSQQIIAGTLASLLLLLPFWAIISFLLQLAAFPVFFEFVVIYLCLNDDHFRQIADEVRIAIGQGNKTRARVVLHPWLNRSTHSLSSIGLSKATIERLLTTPIYGTVATLVFYVVGGVPLVLAARMIKQLELSWPCLSPQYRHFGRPMYLVSTLLFFIPAKLWSLSLAIQGGPKSLLTLFRPGSNSAPLNEFSTCEVAASVLKIELGGPLKFKETKINLPKMRFGPLPEDKDIGKALKLNSSAFTLWMSALVIIPVIWATLRYLQA